jgi:hypothetical protein
MLVQLSGQHSSSNHQYATYNPNQFGVPFSSQRSGDMSSSSSDMLSGAHGKKEEAKAAKDLQKEIHLHQMQLQEVM